MPLRVLLVDDEPVARHRLRRLLHKVGDVTIVTECSDGPAAVAAICEHELDLVFLDVQMPGMNGFEVVRAVGPEGMPQVIFVTAFDQFALRAFEAQALDYLLKPFGEDRVRQALTRARTFLNGVSKQARPGRLTRLLAATANHDTNRLLVKKGDRILLLRPREIDWVEADGDYMHLHAGEDTYFVRSTMAQMEGRLAGDGFVRIHRSRLVNLDRIKELRPLAQGESIVVLKTGARLQASHSCLRQFQDRFESLS